MLKINLSSLEKQINKLVSQYYTLKEKPVLKEVPRQRLWIKDMISEYVEYSIINLELAGINKITVSERLEDIYKDDKVMSTCVVKKGYTIEKKLGEHSNKFLLKGGKTAKVQIISLWLYKQKDELKSMINNEFRICKKAESLGIGPKTYDTFICSNQENKLSYKVVITDYINGMSLEEWMKETRTDKERDEVHGMVKAKIEKMHENGIIHNQLQWSSSNIILKMKGKKVIDVYITDFLHAFDVQDKKMWEYNKWIQGDRAVLNKIQSNVRSYNNADDVVNYVVNELIDKKFIQIS